MRRLGITLITLILLVGLVGFAQPAHADQWTDPPFGGPITSTPGAVCDYAQYWSASLCGKVKPTVPDARPKFVRVHKHDTLWHLAEKWTGSGHNWRHLAQMNHIHGTRIVVGERLRIR